MRTSATFLAALGLSIAIPVSCLRQVAAQETIMIEGDVGDAMEGALMMDTPGACGCSTMRSPPWHGNVGGGSCGPSCPAPTMFHANPCGQLAMKHQARQHGYQLPPCFPRLHGLLADGSFPTPRPITVPRCPRCGAHIEGGF